MTDRLIVLVVLIALAVLSVGTLLGGIVLALNDKSLPGELIAIGSSSAGAIAGILGRTGASEVQVMNRSTDPVPVAAMPEPDDVPTTGAP